MTEQQERAMKLALESLEELVADPECDFGPSYALQQDRQEKAITALTAALEQPDKQCNQHPKAPHGFMRDASHSADRYVCECEGWDAYDAGYQSGYEECLKRQDALNATLDKKAENARELDIQLRLGDEKMLEQARVYADSVLLKFVNELADGLWERWDGKSEALLCKFFGQMWVRKKPEQPTEVIDPDSRTISVYEQPAPVPEAHKQEPVAWVYLDQYGNLHESSSPTVPPETFPVYRHTVTQPAQQEPVALQHWCTYCQGNNPLLCQFNNVKQWSKTYATNNTRPVERKFEDKTLTQAREWVGLTDEEIRRVDHHKVEGAYDYSFKQGAQWAEAKLREKNEHREKNGGAA